MLTSAFGSNGLQVGARRLRNTCLGYLAKPADERAQQTCLEQFRAAACMTDSLAAVSALAGQECAAREEALTAFFERAKVSRPSSPSHALPWPPIALPTAFHGLPSPSHGLPWSPIALPRPFATFHRHPTISTALCLLSRAQANKEALVLNKWLGVQASAETPSALQTVRSLMEHEAYDATNPNSIRSLIQMFASANPSAFHAKDGSGYEFIGEQVTTFHGLPLTFHRPSTDLPPTFH